MENRISRRAALVALTGQGLTGQINRNVGPVTPGRLPLAARRYVTAAGTRLIERGQERNGVVARYQAEGANGFEPLNWIWEFPTKIRVQRGTSAAITFDGQRLSTTGVSDVDSDLIEVLSDDTADRLFDALQRGSAAFRYLGARFTAQKRTGFGATVDVFELAGLVLSRGGGSGAVKYFHFDSSTGLLSRVMYHKMISGVSTRVKTEYSDYGSMGGFPVARRLVRSHGARRRFQIDVQTVQWTPGASDGAFGRP